MSLHKRLAFQRNLLERRSLRAVPPAASLAVAPAPSPAKSPSASPGKSKKKASSSSSSSSSAAQTPLDLELDLAAQKAKFQLLQEELERLKEIKRTLEEHKGRGAKEVPGWLQEQEQFQQILAKVS